jgi:hypothetical protein
MFFYRAMSSALCPTPNLEDQVPVFMPPSDRVAQLYLQTLGSIFIAFYYAQGCGGGILNCLHMGVSVGFLLQIFHAYFMFLMYSIYSPTIWSFRQYLVRVQVMKCVFMQLSWSSCSNSPHLIYLMLHLRVLYHTVRDSDLCPT